jgi:murein DD-endopeptidase MepM/ murein hydrolase activator NlpD
MPARSLFFRLVLCACSVCVVNVAGAQVYRYKDRNGNWVYTDQRPLAETGTETVNIKRGVAPPRIAVEPRNLDSEIAFVAVNECRCKVEFGLRVGPEDDDAQTARVVVDPQTERVLLMLRAPPAGNIAFDYGYVIGEPGTTHSPPGPYRVPFATATGHVVSQAPPNRDTHNDFSSFNAIDFAMPVGTAIVAAREGLVINVAYRFDQGGLNPQMLDEANFVQILHDDGTTAIYGHLQMDSVRVRPGQTVRRGEQIANSGNSGFSGGPHLHFAVLRNAGMRSESVPVVFAGPGGSVITARTGQTLQAY